MFTARKMEILNAADFIRAATNDYFSLINLPTYKYVDGVITISTS